MKVALYNEVALGRWVEKAVLKAGVTPLTGAIIRKVNRQGRRLTSLDIATRHGDVRITATGFIDATGDAAITWEAGFDCRVHKHGQIYGSQMIVIEDFDDSQEAELGRHGGAHPRPRRAVRHDAARRLCRELSRTATSRSST